MWHAICAAREDFSVYDITPSHAADVCAITVITLFRGEVITLFCGEELTICFENNKIINGVYDKET